MQIRRYNQVANVKKKSTLALIADLHNHPSDLILHSLLSERPDYIVINGDLLYAGVPGHSIYEHIAESGQHFRNARYAQKFIKEAVKISKVLFSTGNHELYLDDLDEEYLRQCGVIYLDNEYKVEGEFVFAGLSSPYKYLANSGKAKTREEHRERWEMVFSKVDISWLDEFEEQKGYKVLLSHHPEFYDPYLRERKIDLILSGHAHGGQVRLLGKGLFAYGQGFFPKYTSGIYDHKLIVSRGLANTSRIPRIGNPTELVYIDVIPKESKM